MNKHDRKDVSDSRRNFVKSAGKLAVYTPPAMVALMKPSYASFRLSGGQNFSSYDKMSSYDMPSMDKMSSFDLPSIDWSSKD